MLFLRRDHTPFIKIIKQKQKKQQQQRCEHRIMKNKQIKSTVHDANSKNEINKLCVNKQGQSMKIKAFAEMHETDLGSDRTVILAW